MLHLLICLFNAIPVASLGWVTPGAATEGVTPLFFPEKPGDLFSAHRCHYHYRFLLLSLECHPSIAAVLCRLFIFVTNVIKLNVCSINVVERYVHENFRL